MEKIEYIVDFCVHLGEQLLSCGANLERTNLTIESICRHYGVTEIGLHTMNTMINLSATDENGKFANKMARINNYSIDLEKLRLLIDMSKRITKELPDPASLEGMMNDVNRQVHHHSLPSIMMAFVIAMAALARLFGGSWQDVIISVVNTLILFGFSKGFEKLHLNHIITNFISMFVVSSIAAWMTKIGFVQNFYVVILTNAFYLIPGIPLVNCIRDLLCGNEMNGIIELWKVILECVSLTLGVAASYFFTADWVSMAIEEAFSASDYTNVVYDLELIALSFLASFGFGLIFNMSWKEIAYAGVGAVLVRIVYIVLLVLIPAKNCRFLVFILAAFSADLFSELLVIYKKCPATYYLYSFVVPLIPGDLVVFTMFGIVWRNADLFTAYALDCLIALIGISVGFVFASSIMHFIRKIKLKKLMPLLKRKEHHVKAQ